MSAPLLAAPQSSFTDELWVSIEPIYAAILRHPFIAGLTDGSLPRERFEFYAVQDALYLREFARALAITGGRAPKDDWIIMLADHAAGALRVERTLHEDFFREFDLSAQAVLATPPMHRHFRTTSRYEWMFWDMGYRCEQWPFADESAAPRRPGR